MDLLVRLAEERRLSSAHDVSDGGLAVALAECAMPSGLGAEVSLESPLRASSLLFGETTGRALVTFLPAQAGAVEEAARTSGVPIRVIGTVGGESLRIAVNDRTLVDEPVPSLRELWTTAFARALASAEVL